jgi:hypothetical protein
MSRAPVHRTRDSDLASSQARLWSSRRAGFSEGQSRQAKRNRLTLLRHCKTAAGQWRGHLT